MKVTGIITTYHREAAIVEKAIRSMLNQTYKLFEILVVDDNEDNSGYSPSIEVVCKKLSVIYIKQEGNKGACAARNLGIKHACGEYLGFLDDDDEWLPEKIEQQLIAFQNNQEAGMVYCNGILRVHSEENFVDRQYNSDTILHPSFEELLKADCIGSTSHPLIKKSVFDNVGGFWIDQPARQDYEMWIRISQKYMIVGIPDCLFIHNIHKGEQISKNKKKAYWGYRNIYKRYAKFYKKNKEAKRSIVSYLYVNMYNFSLFNCYIIGLKVFYKVFL